MGDNEENSFSIEDFLGKIYAHYLLFFDVDKFDDNYDNYTKKLIVMFNKRHVKTAMDMLKEKNIPDNLKSKYTVLQNYIIDYDYDYDYDAELSHNTEWLKYLHRYLIFGKFAFRDELVRSGQITAKDIDNLRLSYQRSYGRDDPDVASSDDSGDDRGAGSSDSGDDSGDDASSVARDDAINNELSAVAALHTYINASKPNPRVRGGSITKKYKLRKKRGSRAKAKRN